MLQVQTYDFSDDDGNVNSEVVVTDGDREYIITEYDRGVETSIYERETGQLKAHTRLR